MTHFPRSVTVVDDFAVPWDSEYAFDVYGSGNALDVNYLSSIKVDIPFIFFPCVRAREETGAKSGCAILTGNEELAFARLSQHKSREGMEASSRRSIDHRRPFTVLISNLPCAPHIV